MLLQVTGDQIVQEPDLERPYTAPLIAPIIITASWVPVEALLIAALGTTPGKWLFGVYLQFSISDAYARRDAKSQIQRGFRRAFRVWWSGMGCGVVPVAAVLIAYAYEKVAREQETEWDFAEDCLVTHGPSGTLNPSSSVSAPQLICASLVLPPGPRHRSR